MSDSEWTIQASVKDPNTGLLLNVRGTSADFAENLTVAHGLLATVRGLEADVTSAAPAAHAAAVAVAQQQLGGTVIETTQAQPSLAQPAAPQQGWAQPAAPAAVPGQIVLPQSLAKYNTLVPGVPLDTCGSCGQPLYPCGFTSKAGKPFKKYKCAVNKDHEGSWID